MSNLTLNTVRSESIINDAIGALKSMIRFSRQHSVEWDGKRVLFVEVPHHKDQEVEAISFAALQKLLPKEVIKVVPAETAYFKAACPDQAKGIFDVLSKRDSIIVAAVENASAEIDIWTPVQRVGAEAADFKTHDPFEGTEYKAQKEAEKEKEVKDFFSGLGLDAEEIRNEFKAVFGGKTKLTKDGAKALGIVGGGMMIVGLGAMIMGLAKVAHDSLDK